MTVITYRAGIMACDSNWSDEGGFIVNSQIKIQRLSNGMLYGSAGDVDERALLKILHKVKNANQLPTSEALRAIPEDLSALVVFPNWKIFTIDTGKDGCVCPVQGEFTAIGSGRQVAIGAMAAGASAYSSADIACQHNIYCRPPIHQLRL